MRHTCATYIAVALLMSKLPVFVQETSLACIRGIWASNMNVEENAEHSFLIIEGNRQLSFSIDPTSENLNFPLAESISWIFKGDPKSQ